MAEIQINRKKVLIMSDWFWPGYKAGGPIRAVVNYVNHMQADYDLYIFTSDRDLNASGSYPGIEVDKWISFEKSQVYYCSPSHMSLKKISNMIRDIDPDIIYLNSLFSKVFTIYPLLLFRQKKVDAKIILAPRGMLRSSALQFKSLKKKVFLQLFRALGLQKAVYFQATDAIEKNDVQTHFGKDVKVAQVVDFPNQVNAYPGVLEKRSGHLKIIFIGRLHPIKQLDFLLQVLKNIKGEVVLTVTGDEEDKLYVDTCKQLAQSLTANIKVVFTGGMPNDELPQLVLQHHIFALPTKGENFGHAIFEALALGKPVLISDQTPWLGLADHKSGWDLPLTKPDLFVNVIEKAVAMDQQEYNEWSEGAWRFARNYIEQSNIVTSYKNLFN